MGVLIYSSCFWIVTHSYNSQRKRRGRCGELTVSYTDLKNSGTETLIETLSELLDSYSQRLESIESYVYMQCVGIQLEKHFSQQRSEALAGKTNEYTWFRCPFFIISLSYPYFKCLQPLRKRRTFQRPLALRSARNCHCW